MSSAMRPVLIMAKLHSQAVLSQRPVNPPKPLNHLRIQVWILADLSGKDTRTATMWSTLFGQAEYFQDRRFDGKGVVAMA